MDGRDPEFVLGCWTKVRNLCLTGVLETTNTVREVLREIAIYELFGSYCNGLKLILIALFDLKPKLFE